MTDLKKQLSFVKSARVRNRGGKLYLTVEYKKSGSFDLHQTVQAQIAQVWPKARCTSGGPSGCTYRLNPDWKIEDK